MKNAITLQINRDLLTYGEAATVEDRDRFAENLSAHLTEKFELDEVVVVLGDREAVTGNKEIHDYVRFLVEGDGWTSFI